MRPRLAGVNTALVVHHADPVLPRAIDDEGARVDEDLVQARKERIRSVEAKQARLGRDGDAHLVGHGEPVATDEGLFRDEYLDVLPELPLQVRRKTAHAGHALAQDAAPRGGKRAASDAPAPRGIEPGLRADPCHHKEGDAHDAAHQHDARTPPDRPLVIWGLSNALSREGPRRAHRPQPQVPQCEQTIHPQALHSGSRTLSSPERQAAQSAVRCCRLIPGASNPRLRSPLRSR
jgi:hypothetical protein